MRKIKAIGVLTSGGDAPGMNACVRAVTRAAIFEGWKVYGIYRGWEGLIKDKIKEMTTEDVSNTIQRGGTILKTARSEEFRTPEGRAKAYENIKKYNIDALVVIGGNGSLAGAQALASEYDIPVIGLPGTIDNDLYGTDSTIGYDTALNTIMECVDKIRDTASSHERLFIVEVMGRDAGFLALNGTIATGAEACVLPEIDPEFEKINQFIANGLRRTKSSSIVLFAEGREKDYNIMEVAEGMRQRFPELDVRVSILGYLQRGGSPTANDRILASRLGVAAIDALLEGQRNVMIGLRNNEMVYIPFTKAIKDDKPIDKETVRAQEILAS